jgi:hypothetical protein
VTGHGSFSEWAGRRYEIAVQIFAWIVHEAAC